MTKPISPPEPLRFAVERSVKHYLSTLDGSAVVDLYGIVLAEVESALIETLLEHTQNNQSRTAEMLGLSRATLRKKIRDLHLNHD